MPKAGVTGQGLKRKRNQRKQSKRSAGMNERKNKIRNILKNNGSKGYDMAMSLVDKLGLIRQAWLPERAEWAKRSYAR